MNNSVENIKASIQKKIEKISEDIAILQKTMSEQTDPLVKSRCKIAIEAKQKEIEKLKVTANQGLEKFVYEKSNKELEGSTKKIDAAMESGDKISREIGKLIEANDIMEKEKIKFTDNQVMIDYFNQCIIANLNKIETLKGKLNKKTEKIESLNNKRVSVIVKKQDKAALMKSIKQDSLESRAESEMEEAQRHIEALDSILAFETGNSKKEKKKLEQEQIQYYKEYLTFNKILEDYKVNGKKLKARGANSFAIKTWAKFALANDLEGLKKQYDEVQSHSQR